MISRKQCFLLNNMPPKRIDMKTDIADGLSNNP